MFKSICKRAIGLASRQAIVSGADVIRRGLAVLMLLVTTSVILNLATPQAAAAADLPDVSVSFSRSTIDIGEISMMTVTITNNTTYVIGDMIVGRTVVISPSFSGSWYSFPSKLIAGTIESDCGADIYRSGTAYSAFISNDIPVGASCTITIELTGSSLGVASFNNFQVGYVSADGNAAGIVRVTVPGITVAAPPTPTLTFADTGPVYIPLNGTGSNPATSTIADSGAGAISYSSSNTNVATVNANTGAYTGLQSGDVTITATQAAAAGVNSAATASFTLSVAPAVRVDTLSPLTGPTMDSPEPAAAQAVSRRPCPPSPPLPD